MTKCENCKLKKILRMSFWDYLFLIPIPRKSTFMLNGRVIESCSCSPGDDVAIDLQKLEELLGLLSVSVLLFSGQGVIGNQQRVGPSSWEKQRDSQHSSQPIGAGTNGQEIENRTFANEFGLLLLGPDVVVVFCNHFHHALQKERRRKKTTSYGPVFMRIKSKFCSGVIFKNKPAAL